MALRPEPTVPMKQRRSNPARVSLSSLALARVVEPKPAAAFAISRSSTRIWLKAERSFRSRGWRSSPAFSVPVMQLLPEAFAALRRSKPHESLPDLCFDLLPWCAPAPSDPRQQVGRVSLGLGNTGDLHFDPMVRPALEHNVALDQILEQRAQ